MSGAGRASDRNIAVKRSGGAADNEVDRHASCSSVLRRPIEPGRRPGNRSSTEVRGEDQMRENAKLSRMLQGPDYCLQLFLETVVTQPPPAFRRRRIRS